MNFLKSWVGPVITGASNAKCMIFYTFDCKILYLIANDRFGLFL